MIRIPQSLVERSVFVDTSAFYAATNAADRHHEGASVALRHLHQERRPLFTSNLVLGETYGLLRRFGHALAMRWLGRLDVNVAFQEELDHDPALAILDRYDDRRLSYIDAVSFAIMERLGIRTAFAFDADFRVYGFEVIP